MKLCIINFYLKKNNNNIIDRVYDAFLVDPVESDWGCRPADGQAAD